MPREIPLPEFGFSIKFPDKEPHEQFIDAVLAEEMAEILEEEVRKRLQPFLGHKMDWHLRKSVEDTVNRILQDMLGDTQASIKTTVSPEGEIMVRATIKPELK